MLGGLAKASTTVMFYEGARFHQQRFSEFGDRFGQIAALVREGLEIPASRYEEALHFIAGCKAQVLESTKPRP